MNWFSLSAPAGLALCCSLHAQGPAFDSPGMSGYATMGQTTRFSTEFNPALGFVIDGFFDYFDPDDGDTGFDAQLRLLELNGSAFIDPKAWAYVVITSEQLESPQVEEAAAVYTGLSGNQTIKAGAFFVDFGKQMLVHQEELRTLERPLVLRTFLGEELSGVGAQYDNWFAAGESTPVRFSLGVFASLLGENEGEDDEPAVEGAVPDRKDIDELSFAGRATGLHEVGENGQVQLGASIRYVPEFTFEFNGLEVDGLSNIVWGADATYGWVDDTGNKNLVVGGEFLVFDGDLSGAVDDPAAPTTLTVVDDQASGLYFYGDYAWNPNDSAGLQYSWIESPDDPDADQSELDFYYTRNFTEFRRLRLGVTLGDVDGDDSTRVYLQLTNFFGSHTHGINW